MSTILLAILIGALGFAFSGQTINVMTLGGLALAIGTVVDAAIVVVENVVRHGRMGKTPAVARARERRKSPARFWQARSPPWPSFCQRLP